MKRWMATACAAVAMAGLGAAASAKPIPDGGVTVEEVRAFFEENGYRAQIEADRDGRKHLNSGADGLKFSVYFYDCKQDRCAAMEYYVGFDKGEDTPNLEKVNAWNRDKRYMKAYLDAEGDIGFEYDANVSPGGSWEALEDDFNTFLSFLPEIKKLVNW